MITSSFLSILFSLVNITYIIKLFVFYYLYYFFFSCSNLVLHCILSFQCILDFEVSPLLYLLRTNHFFSSYDLHCLLYLLLPYIHDLGCIVQIFFLLYLPLFHLFLIQYSFFSFPHQVILLNHEFKNHFPNNEKSKLWLENFIEKNKA